jgi:hypothetical protein
MVNVKKTEKIIKKYEHQKEVPASAVLKIRGIRLALREELKNCRYGVRKKLRTVLATINNFIEKLQYKVVVAKHVSRQLNDFCAHYGVKIVIFQHNQAPRYINY